MCPEAVFPYCEIQSLAVHLLIPNSVGEFLFIGRPPRIGVKIKTKLVISVVISHFYQKSHDCSNIFNKVSYYSHTETGQTIFID